MTAQLLHEQTVVVLGGSSGIGWAVAEVAAAERAKVFALSRSGKAPRALYPNLGQPARPTRR
jgi:NAD(P)-dependent dehydrogenase (short-subunit alcohol dehydrogenase family)